MKLLVTALACLLLSCGDGKPKVTYGADGSVSIDRLDPGESVEIDIPKVIKSQLRNSGQRLVGQPLMLFDVSGRGHIVGEWDGSRWVYIPDPDPTVNQPKTLFPTKRSWSAGIDDFHRTFLDFYGADSLVFSILKIDGRKLPANKRYIGY